jgi:hypothetical protein
MASYVMKSIMATFPSFSYNYVNSRCVIVPKPMERKLSMRLINLVLFHYGGLEWKYSTTYLSLRN